jgi:hypothetical protein
MKSSVASRQRAPWLAANVTGVARQHEQGRMRDLQLPSLGLVDRSKPDAAQYDAAYADDALSRCDDR